jgi:rRNA-processing protein EBP2
MAKVKDRLIFETKKMDAVAMRKTNKEQKLRSKEAHANKIAEKSKKKKEQVDNWAKSAANNRGGALDDDQDEKYLGRMQKPGFKRQNANAKYGFGGTKGRFKQPNDSKSLNDMKGFNPKGNSFKGGQKGKGSGGGKGAARPGKRSRDASRSK